MTLFVVVETGNIGEIWFLIVNVVLLVEGFATIVVIVVISAFIVVVGPFVVLISFVESPF